jgi:hypothetical protein
MFTLLFKVNGERFFFKNRGKSVLEHYQLSHFHFQQMIHK